MTIPIYHAIGGVLKRKGRADRQPGGTTAYGPVSVADINEFQSKGLGVLPTDANFVNWTWATGTDLDTVFKSLGSNDILVLPEDENPYVVNQMYRTADGTANGANPTTDRSACRSKRGIIGLGPNAIIAPSATFPSYAAQTANEGARESLVENWTANSYHANFTIKGRNIGGLAFHALKLEAGGAVVDRVRTLNHYGFLGHQPGEVFGIILNGDAGTDATSTIRRCEIDGSNQTTGAKEGSGGIHLVKGGVMNVENCYIHDVRGGGIALYWRLGATNVSDTKIYRIGDSTVLGRGVNIEVSGTNTVTLNRLDIQLANAGQRPHLAVVSVNGGSYPAGATPVYVNDIVFDEAAVKVWTNVSGSGTYGGYTNLSTINDVHFTPSNTPVANTNFGS